jgi:hypothetical protein
LIATFSLQTLHFTLLISLPKVAGPMVNVLLLTFVISRKSRSNRHTSAVTSHLLPSFKSCTKSIPHHEKALTATESAARTAAEKAAAAAEKCALLTFWRPLPLSPACPNPEASPRSCWQAQPLQYGSQMNTNCTYVLCAQNSYASFEANISFESIIANTALTCNFAAAVDAIAQTESYHAESERAPS